MLQFNHEHCARSPMNLSHRYLLHSVSFVLILHVQFYSDNEHTHAQKALTPRERERDTKKVYCIINRDEKQIKKKTKTDIFRDCRPPAILFLYLFGLIFLFYFICSSSIRVM